jgi:AcrR family transcriptional regulator
MKSSPRRAPVGRPPGANRSTTTARILAAARAHFARTGYAATTNQQIADDAGVTTGTLYLYFESKTALFMATVRDAYADLVPHYREAAAGARTLREGFRAVLAVSVPLHARDPSLAAFLSTLPVEMSRHEELARAMTQERDEVLTIFDELVRLGVRSGEISAAAAPRVLSLFVACTVGFSLFASAIDGSQLAGIIEAFNALIDGKLFREPRRRRR